MNTLPEFITEYGGKLGGVEYFRQHPELVPGIEFPEQTLFGPKDLEKGDIPRTLERNALAIAAVLGEGTKIVIRTSVSDDWRGFIDKLPTVFVNELDLGGNMDYLRGGLMEYIRAMMIRERAQLMRDTTELQKHGQREGTSFDPERVTFALSPFLGSHTGMVTEHPNYPDALLIDQRIKDGERERCDSHIDSNIYAGENIDTRSFTGKIDDVLQEAGLKIHRVIRGSNVLDPNMTYQIEFCVHPLTGNPVLLQIREFLPRNNYPVVAGEVPESLRSFGDIKPGEELVLPIVKRNKMSHFEDFENEKGGENSPYCAEILMSDQRDRWQPGWRAKGFLKLIKPAMSHAMTQPVVSVVRNGGVAILGWYGACPTNKIRFYFDPTNSSIQSEPME